MAERGTCCTAVTAAVDLAYLLRFFRVTFPSSFLRAPLAGFSPAVKRLFSAITGVLQFPRHTWSRYAVLTWLFHRALSATRWLMVCGRPRFATELFRSSPRSSLPQSAFGRCWLPVRPGAWFTWFLAVDRPARLPRLPVTREPAVRCASQYGHGIRRPPGQHEEEHGAARVRAQSTELSMPNRSERWRADFRRRNGMSIR